MNIFNKTDGLSIRHAVAVFLQLIY